MFLNSNSAIFLLAVSISKFFKAFEANGENIFFAASTVGAGGIPKTPESIIKGPASQHWW